MAVPAGAEATVTLKPTHGCGGSPTVAVRIRAPFPDAVRRRRRGLDGVGDAGRAGNTVLEWTGGLLPADEDGRVPGGVRGPRRAGHAADVPGHPGLRRRAELAWISGDPDDEFPAPRVLVLPAGSPAAATIDDVPLDAPGRDQLVAIVDVDNPQATPSTAPPTTVPATTVAGRPRPPADDAPTPAGDDDDQAPTTPTTGGGHADHDRAGDARRPRPTDDHADRPSGWRRRLGRPRSSRVADRRRRGRRLPPRPSVLRAPQRRPLSGSAGVGAGDDLERGRRGRGRPGSGSCRSGSRRRRRRPRSSGRPSG